MRSSPQIKVDLKCGEGRPGDRRENYKRGDNAKDRSLAL